MAARKAADDAPITIKKYANRRLYNTATSSYVTLDDLAAMVKEDQEFVVYDAKSGDDITRAVLTQIIVEEEAKGQNLLPVGFLRQLIAFYGDSLQGLVPKYLEQSMDAFTSNQEEMRQHLAKAFDGVFPFGSLEDMSRRNIELMQQAMQMFNPFVAGGDAPSVPDEPQPDGRRGSASRVDDDENEGGDRDLAGGAGDEVLVSLQDQIEALKQQVDALSRRKKVG